MMTTYQVDPDVARWGLHLIDMCSLSNYGSPHTLTCYVEDFSRTQSVTEGFFNPNVENDEVIAHALQDDLSRPSNGSVFMCAGKKYLNGPNGAVAPDWVEPSALDSHSEFQSSQEEEKKEAVLTNLEGLSVESEQQGTFPEIEDESDIDGELGKRLNRMVAVPHVPKINGDLPSTDEESSDHQRLMDRLQVYELTELKIFGDGNCQFRSLSDQIYRTPEHHKFVREQVVSQLKSQPELYGNYVPMAYSDYLKKMNK